MPHSGAGSRARRVACYFELPRIPLLRTPLNKGKGESAGVVLLGPQQKGGLRPPRPSLRLAPKKHFDAARTSSPPSWR
jgi:hypothetical protein